MQGAGDNIVESIGETHRLGARGFAALSLLAANLGMLLIYVAFDLTLFQLVLIYWWEALWIGTFSGLKLLTASLFGNPYENRWVNVSPGSALFISLFAVFKSTAFFITLLGISGVALVVAQQELTGIPGDVFMREQASLMLKFSLIFFIGHGLSFVINFLLLGEYRDARFSDLLMLPFKRALALLFAIVASLTATQLMPGVATDTLFAAFLIVLKLVWDYFLHRRERHTFSTAGIELAAQK
ncbi:MAG: DUF6498-containing protein [Woeseiaceae bacterium]